MKIDTQKVVAVLKQLQALGTDAEKMPNWIAHLNNQSNTRLPSSLIDYLSALPQRVNQIKFAPSMFRNNRAEQEVKLFEQLQQLIPDTQESVARCLAGHSNIIADPSATSLDAPKDLTPRGTPPITVGYK